MNHSHDAIDAVLPLNHVLTTVAQYPDIPCARCPGAIWRCKAGEEPVYVAHCTRIGSEVYTSDSPDTATLDCSAYTQVLIEAVTEGLAEPKPQTRYL